jgi:enterobactin synthetase component F
MGWGVSASGSGAALKHNDLENQIRQEIETMDARTNQGGLYESAEGGPYFYDNLLDGAKAERRSCFVKTQAEKPAIQLPLATAQRGMWMGEKIAPQGALYNLAECCEILGEINPEIFLAATRRLTDEAETCRVQIIDTDEGPAQLLLPSYPGELPYFDFSSYDDAAERADTWMREDVTRRLDIALEPLWFAALFKIDEQRYFWYQRCHHISLDGFGAGVLIRRLSDIYNALIKGEEPEENVFFGLREQLAEEQAYRDSKRYARDKEYWNQAMAGLPEPLSLSKGGERSGGLRRSSIELSLAHSARLRAVAEQYSGTLPQLMISLLAAYIYRMSGAEDLVFGMPVSARVSRQQRSTPCMMANAVAIRLAMAADLSMPDLVSQVASTVRSALRHQQYRYEELRRDLGLLGQGQQIAWVGVNIEPFDYDLRFGEASTLCHNLSNGTIEDLTTFVYDRGSQQPIRIDMDANPALYTQAELDEHASRLQRVVEAVLACPEIELGKIELLGTEERETLLFQWNDTAKALPETTVIDLFEAQAARTPDAVAAIDARGKISYARLNDDANLLAGVLREAGAQRGELIAVALPRGTAMLGALLAVQKSGAAYLPLDPDAPAERIAAILQEAKPRLMLGDTESLARLCPEGQAQLDLARLSLPELAAQRPVTGPRDPIAADDPVYVIYTSGSTGRPKGVVIDHRNLLNFILSMQEELDLGEHSRVLALTTVAFDIATLELYLPLICGAASVIADRDTARDPEALTRFIQSNHVSVVQATPSHWQLLMMNNQAALKGIQALVGGEALPASLAQQLGRLGPAPINLYGPTETTVWSSLMRLQGDDLTAPPIGRPIWNTQLYVLDSACAPVPVGVVGELYIGGEGVAQGYLHRPELTAERFMPNPFAEGQIYRTGDLVRWREDGVLEYLGRNDFQIKIRGFRVEVGDIEAAINKWPGISSSAVVLAEDGAGAKQLVAYILWPGDAASLDIASLRRQLQGQLPDYMQPALFIPLQAFPTNVNGKLDRKALPAPEWVAKQDYVAPNTELEHALVGLWQELLGVEKIGIQDSFFDLGGDSIKAAMMVSRLRELLGRDVPMAALFEASTVEELASNLEQCGQGDIFETLLRLKPAYDASPLFCIHPVLGLGWSFAGLNAYLGENRGLYALQAAGLDGVKPMAASITDMASAYIAELRQVQPHGPYRLMGWSLGGIVAHEMTRQLEELGEKVAFLSLLDSYPHITESKLGVVNEARAIEGALEFLGFDRRAISDMPTTMDGLTEYLCQAYDIHNLPMVSEMQRALPATGGSIVDNVRNVIENNLKLLREHVPGAVEADMLFLQASQSADADLSSVLQQSPEVWCRHARSVEVMEVACRHQEMMDAEALQIIGPMLANALERADRVMWRSVEHKLPSCA